MGSVSRQCPAGECAQPKEEPGDPPGPESEEDKGLSRGVGICKWFNVRMGFGFLAMVISDGVCLDTPVDVFVHQSKLHMEGFCSLKEGEQVEFTFKKSAKGLEFLRVMGLGGATCVGIERMPKGKTQSKRKSIGNQCYNCEGLNHHAKECKLPPQPKKCYYCQSISHVVAIAQAKPNSYLAFKKHPTRCQKKMISMKSLPQFTPKRTINQKMYVL